MLKIIVSAIFAATLAFASGAAGALPGQCYTADGVATGPAYDSAAPDRDWIRFITERGGRCTGLGQDTAEDPPRFTKHEAPNHRHLERFQQMQRD
jgi:hypothetical protein